ncbi:Putative RNA polymerase II subunit A C-terminal domain phosphatase SSU72 [Rhizopus microsporus]|nr:Putative RNA polymerase II subunit A C-terminal domain phosphatase SSU72 [Rhizopus microsporus]
MYKAFLLMIDIRKKGFNVNSYGTGTMVRLPGPSIDKPNIYPFGTPYEQVYQELKSKDPNLYTQNGLLNMLDRNRKTKPAPQRWHESREVFDVIITCEERCFDAVVEDLVNRGQNLNQSTHVINVEIKDNHEDALLGGRAILQLAQMIEASTDIDADMDGIIEEFTSRNPSFPILHTVTYF